jgi:5'-3' exoribonuclease 2
MGIPAAFRWLSSRYPKIISPVIEDQPLTMEDGSTIPVDTTRPNPNGEEFDNLYLDMNGIVHPCSHPEDRPAPKDEEEMMMEVFRYTDRVVNMVRPRKILMIAVGMLGQFLFLDSVSAGAAYVICLLKANNPP